MPVYHSMVSSNLYFSLRVLLFDEVTLLLETHAQAHSLEYVYS